MTTINQEYPERAEADFGIQSRNIGEVTRVTKADTTREQTNREAMEVIRQNLAKYMPAQVSRDTLRKILFIINNK